MAPATGADGLVQSAIRAPLGAAPKLNLHDWPD
jgi:hypothetical protein